MAADNVLKNFNLFVDGRGYAGNVDEYNPPDLTLVTEDHRAGGMDAPIRLDMGMEALEASFVLSDYDPDVLALFGVAEGNSVPFTARGALESYDGTVTAVVHNMQGKITSLARGTWTPGSKATLTVTIALKYYKETHGDTVIHEIDIENMVRTVNGTDRLAEIREALGI